ncbi:MAG: hypothetical protein IT518_24815, partial [Burkholderiales bacterium]|nr:hypothetical protein [Burkholderiales bacterium]
MRISALTRSFDDGKTWFSAPAALLIAAIFVIPLAAVALQSVYRTGFTLDGYQRILASTLFWRVLWTTLEITLEATILSVLLGYPLA